MDATLAYHERSKHLPSRFAPSLGYLDWETQPDPFRRFEGAKTFPLALVPVASEPRYELALVLGHVDPAPLDATTVARLFNDALALSAWKEVPGSRWALRVNPSSGNLHPTEGYLVSGPVAGLHDEPAVYHYAPLIHSLELRTTLSRPAWRSIAAQLPDQALLIGLSTIHWRESWKYGERAFRYCHHDVGHAIACIAVAAAGLGWEARLLEGVVDGPLATLLGVHLQSGAEAEHADCLLSVFPQRAPLQPEAQRSFRLGAEVVDALRSTHWIGQRNVLSQDHHDWPAIDEVAAATEKHAAPSDDYWSSCSQPNESLEVGDSPLSLRGVIHQRRSAVALDGHTGITREAFYQILLRAMPGSGQIPFTSLPWRPRVDLLLFVHRVEDLPRGLYVLLRDPARKDMLRRSMAPGFAWRRAAGCPSSLPLFALAEGDVRSAAQQTSCGQAIAADGAFAVAMLAEYREPLDAYGAWFYRRLYWETGVVGQILYLEAEAIGIRGTGIGCFFDDLTHRVFGLEGDRYQVLYHFTMGGPVDDARLQTHPPYQHLARSAASREGST
ncbi:MAG: SagB/ThcOx family dehydrogenase [Polyangiales bacterium]